MRKIVLRYILRILAVLSACLAALNPHLSDMSFNVRHVLVLQDVSDSLDPVKTRVPAGSTRWYFASSTATDSTSLDTSQTRLSQALRQVSSRADEFSAVVIRTDGQFTGHWQEHAVQLAQTGIKVFVEPVGMSISDAGITDMQIPRAGDNISGWVKLFASVSADRTVQIENTAGSVVFSRTVSLPAQQTIKVPFFDTPNYDRPVKYTARLIGDDEFAQNDSASVSLQTRKGVLHISSTQRPSENFVEDILSCSTVVIEDQSGELLNYHQRKTVWGHVLGGGGLVLIGAGPYGSPADRDDPLNKISALIPSPLIRSELDVTVVLDVSGSMAQVESGTRREKMQLATEAVLNLKKHLTEKDTLRIITFSDEPKMIYESAGPADFDVVARELRKIAPAGTTVVLPAIELACKSKPAGQNLVVVVSDMMTEKFSLEQAADLLEGAGVRLEVIATGAGRSGELIKLSKLKNVRFQKAGSLGELAGIFSGFLKEYRRESIPDRAVGLVADKGAALLKCETQRLQIQSPIPAGKFKNSNVIFMADNLPAVALRQVGLGMSAMVAGEGIAPAGAQKKIISRMIELVETSRVDSRYSVSAARSDYAMQITVSVIDDDGPVNFLELTGRCVWGDRKTTEIKFVQTGPGKYIAKLSGNLEGLMSIGVYEKDKLRAAYSPARVTPSEYLRTGVNYENLRKLADLCGGQIIEPLSDVGDISRQVASPVGLRYVFGVLALVFVLLDWIYVRKL